MEAPRRAQPVVRGAAHAVTGSGRVPRRGAVSTAPTRWRWRAIGLALVCLAAAGIDGVIATEELVHLVRGFTRNRDVIASGHGLSTGLLLTPMALALSWMFAIAKQATPEQMRNVTAGQTRRASRFLLFIGVSLVAALAAPIAQFAIIDRLALRRGYHLCPTPGWPRHQPDRWARDPVRCPGEGADPNR